MLNAKHEAEPSLRTRRGGAEIAVRLQQARRPQDVTAVIGAHVSESGKTIAAATIGAKGITRAVRREMQATARRAQQSGRDAWTMTKTERADGETMLWAVAGGAAGALIAAAIGEQLTTAGIPIAETILGALGAGLMSQAGRADRNEASALAILAELKSWGEQAGEWTNRTPCGSQQTIVWAS